MSRKSVKVKATSFFRPEFRDNLKEAMKVCHEIAHRASLVLKVYYLKEYEANPNAIIKLEIETIKTAFEAVQQVKDIQVRRGRKLDRSKEEFASMTDEQFEEVEKRKIEEKAAQDSKKKELFNTFASISDSLFAKRIHTKLSLSHILQRRVEMFETSYLNNIVFHFDKYVKRMIRYQFGNNTPVTKNTIKFLFSRNDDGVSEHICPFESFEFVASRFDYIINASFKDIKALVEENPWVFLNKMVGMNREFEEIEATRERKKRLYSPLSIITTFIPSHIHLDTPGLVQLLLNKGNFEDLKGFYKKATGMDLRCKGKEDVCSSYEKLTGLKDPDGVLGAEHNTVIWKFFTYLEDSKFKHLLQTTRKSSNGDSTNWVFNNFIATDGVSMSVVLCKESEKKLQVKHMKRKAATLFKKREFENAKTLSQSTIDNIIDSDEYLIISVDPGKSNIITATNGQETFKYTSRQRSKDMKVKKRAAKNNKRTLELSQEYRDALAVTNSRSCFSEKFISYVKAKFTEDETVEALYLETEFRSRKFLAYTLDKSSEDKMLHRFKEWIEHLSNRILKGRGWMQGKAEDDSTMQKIVDNVKSTVKKVVLFYGAWGNTPNLKHSSPTPGIGLKRKFSKMYELIEICEYMTSQTCPCCRQRTLEHPKFADKDFKGSRHQLLRCTNANCDCKWWSRDNLGSFNIAYKGIEDLKKARDDQSRPSDNLQSFANNGTHAILGSS